MDPIQIILVIGGVIAALIILWAIIAGFFARRAKRAFDQHVAQMFNAQADDPFFTHGLHNRR